MLITHITPCVEDTMSMLKGIQGLNRLTVLSHCRGSNYGINTRGSIFPFESNKIKGGPNSEGAPVIVTKIIDRVTLFGVLIEIPQNDNILVGMSDGIVREVFEKRCRVFNRSIHRNTSDPLLLQEHLYCSASTLLFPARKHFNTGFLKPKRVFNKKTSTGDLRVEEAFFSVNCDCRQSSPNKLVALLSSLCMQAKRSCFVYP